MNKNEIIAAILMYRSEVEEGNQNPLDVYTDLKQIEDAVKSAKEGILEDVLTEFDKHGQKTVQYHGYEFAATQSGRYDFSGNKDWADHKSNMLLIEDRMKSAYKNVGLALVNEGTGEVFQPASYKSSKRSIKIKKLK